MTHIDDRWTSPKTDGKRVPNTRFGTGARWRARYYDGNGKQHTKVFARKVDAQKWLDSVTTRRTDSVSAISAGAARTTRQTSKGARNRVLP